MIMYLSPFFWLVIHIFQTNVELASVPPRFRPHAEDPLINYKVLLFHHQPNKRAQQAYQAEVPNFTFLFPRAVFNSFFVAIGTAILTLVLACFPAYTFARVNFRYKEQLMFFTLALRMFPVIIVVIPLFIVLDKVGLIDNIFGLILCYSGFMLPYAIWMLFTYFQTIPAEIEESSIIDGCNQLQTITRIVLPLARPGLVATGLFIVLVSWNEFLFALILTHSESSYTLPVIVSMFTQHLQLTPFDLMITAGVIGTIIPIIIIFVLQKYIVKEIAVGGIR
jgi:multiple sugar transport system permease protein